MQFVCILCSWWLSKSFNQPSSLANAEGEAKTKAFCHEKGGLGTLSAIVFVGKIITGHFVISTDNAAHFELYWFITLTMAQLWENGDITCGIDCSSFKSDVTLIKTEAENNLSGVQADLVALESSVFPTLQGRWGDDPAGADVNSK